MDPDTGKIYHTEFLPPPPEAYIYPNLDLRALSQNPYPKPWPKPCPEAYSNPCLKL